MHRRLSTDDEIFTLFYFPALTCLELHFGSTVNAYKGITSTTSMISLVLRSKRKVLGKTTPTDLRVPFGRVTVWDTHLPSKNTLAFLPTETWSNCIFILSKMWLVIASKPYLARFRLAVSAIRMRSALSLIKPPASAWLYAPPLSSKVAIVWSNKVFAESREITDTDPL